MPAHQVVAIWGLVTVGCIFTVLVLIAYFAGDDEE